VTSTDRRVPALVHNLLAYRLKEEEMPALALVQMEQMERTRTHEDFDGVSPANWAGLPEIWLLARHHPE